jgi:hypothetical protein
MAVSEAHEAKELPDENARLKKLLAGPELGQRDAERGDRKKRGESTRCRDREKTVQTG